MNFGTATRMRCLLPSFQISAESFQAVPTFSHTTRYLPVTSCGVGLMGPKSN